MLFEFKHNKKIPLKNNYNSSNIIYFHLNPLNKLKTNFHILYSFL